MSNISQAPQGQTSAELAEQIKAEFAAGGPQSAAEISEMRAQATLLDARQMPSIILQGEVGTGKTKSLESLLAPGTGIEKVFVVACEPGVEDVLGHIPSDRLAWHGLPVGEGSFAGLVDMVMKINTLHPDVIQSGGGINRHMYQEMLKLLGLCNKFVDDRTGKDYGSVFKFPQNTCLWFESISALSEIAKNNAIGDKPFMELRDYQTVQATVMKFLNQLVFNTKCLFVATAHIEREQNENNNLSELMITTVGRKLAPRLPRFFSDVVGTFRDDSIPGKPRFYWGTQVPGMRTKTRNLPWSPNLPPDFGPLLKNFRERQEAARKAEEALKAKQVPKVIGMTP
jgi:hypothetical protein